MTRSAAPRAAAPMQPLLDAIAALRRGDLTGAHLGPNPGGDLRPLATAWNALLDEVIAPVVRDVTRVGREIADGRLGAAARVPAAQGVWRELVDATDAAAAALTWFVRDLARVSDSVARGDLGERITVDARGETGELKATINTMIDRLAALGGEMAGSAQQLAAEGRPALDSPGADVAGVWRDFSLNVRLARQIAIVSRSKSEFLANMSHELRTPLNSLLILAKVLADNKDGNLTCKQVEYAETIQGAGRDLLALISEILDFSKMSAGKMRVEVRPVALCELVARLERTFRPVAESRGLTFAVAIAADCPPLLATDGQRLTQILQNLLSNACKFTETGGVAVAIGPGHAGGDAPTLTFVVRDTGIGIAADKHALVFEPFQQADGSTSRRYGGTGLGLSISRGLAELLGGTLTLASAPGQGSTFTLTIPVNLPASAEVRVPGPTAPWLAPATPSRPTDAVLAGRRVLVVDDDARNIFALASLLETHELQLSYAQGGQQALDVLERSPDIDAVLLDVMMPDLDGYEVLRRLRASPTHRDLPVIAVTARALPEDRQRCLAAGATAYLPKPVDPAALLDALRSVLAR